MPRNGDPTCGAAPPVTAADTPLTLFDDLDDLDDLDDESPVPAAEDDRP